MSTGLDVARQLDLHVTKQRNHLELLQVSQKNSYGWFQIKLNASDKWRKVVGWMDQTKD